MTDPQLPPPSPYGSAPVPPAPSYQTPPGSYTAPVGGYSTPQGAYQAPVDVPAPRPATLGVLSFVLSLVAVAVAPIIAGIAGYEIGFRLPSVATDVDAATSDLSFLSPVRDQVLLGEIGFWVGTLTGIVAIVLGIVAIAKRRGRVWGIIGLILAALGPVIFFVVLGIALGVGAGTGAVSLYGA
ncbi:DUF4064 domain-containing protein [Microbacterium abyssi]|uniref:DUF4064 domain-containing protein n=1 Tax=Microbacterium abyssi TaxID=2782166 RepID=UPI001E627403|nr:DUF4064 domain-containing protein [Microbacterium sp. A18JL241]